MKEQFNARMLRIHFGENDRWQGKPLHEAILASAWSWALPRRWSFAASRATDRASRIRHASHWPRGKDAPIQMSIIDTEEQISKLIPYLDAMVEEGLVAASAVEVIRYSNPATSPM